MTHRHLLFFSSFLKSPSTPPLPSSAHHHHHHHHHQQPTFFPMSANQPKSRTRIWPIQSQSTSPPSFPSSGSIICPGVMLGFDWRMLRPADARVGTSMCETLSRRTVCSRTRGLWCELMGGGFIRTLCRRHVFLFSQFCSTSLSSLLSVVASGFLLLLVHCFASCHYIRLLSWSSCLSVRLYLWHDVPF
jgi:hypothetical protein